ATRWTCPSVHRIPATGPATGKNSTLPRSPMRVFPLARAFELELDVDEVVRRPGAGVLERQEIIVAVADAAHALVELFAARALDQERRVHDHAITDDLVAAARDGDRLQGLVDIGDETVAGLLEGGLDQPPELHAREIRRRAGVVRDLVLEPADLVVLLLE